MTSGNAHLGEDIRKRVKRVTDPAGREVDVLHEADASEIAATRGLTIRDVYGEALGANVSPYRYFRNREAISLEEQQTLADSVVAVVGAGGLGGHVVLLLARIGIGRLVVVDRDVFDETNLNRQALSSVHMLGRLKCEVAAEAVRAINPSAEVKAKAERLEASNAAELLTGCQVAVDALDNIRDRFVLERAAKEQDIPLVHGALAGFEGQLMTIYPEDPGMELLYGHEGGGGDVSRSPEAVLGVPALMPSLVATFQAMEVVKILLGRGRTFKNRLVHFDLETGEIKEFSLGSPADPA